jgi:hypothetical protein
LAGRPACPTFPMAEKNLSRELANDLPMPLKIARSPFLDLTARKWCGSNRLPGRSSLRAPRAAVVPAVGGAYISRHGSAVAGRPLRTTGKHRLLQRLWAPRVPFRTRDPNRPSRQIGFHGFRRRSACLRVSHDADSGLCVLLGMS